jgi:hypothetical protein
MDTPRRTTWLQTLAAAALAGGLALSGAPASAAVLSADRPDGFDILLLPQTTMVDVYYGGQRVGSAMAEYTPGKIRFKSPSGTLALIPHVTNAGPLLNALEGDLPTHADRACADEANGKCRRLDPETIGVVFDQAHFRADVFVNPAYVSIDTPVMGHYLPTSKAGPSLAAGLGGQLSGSERSGADYNVQGRMIAAYRNAHLTLDVSHTPALGSRLDGLAAAVDKGPLRAQAGLLTSLPLDLLDQGHFYGVALGSQTDTLINRDQVAANPIPLYLPNKAQVDILRNGRLMSSRSYPAGNQLIDTTGLPEGSYTIVLRIREAGGYVHDETRSITKNSSLPPMGMPQFFVGAGLAASDTTTGAPRAEGLFAQAGYARRLSISTSIKVSATWVDGHTMAEAGVDYATARGLRLKASLLASGDTGYGLLLASSFNVTRASVITVDFRQSWGDDSHNWTVKQNAAVADGGVSSAFSPIMTGSQFSASYSMTVRGAQIGVVGSYHSAPGTKANYAFGPSIDVPIRFAKAGLRLVASATQTDQGIQAFVGLRMLFTHGLTSVTADAGLSSTATQGQRQSGPIADVTATVDRPDSRFGLASGSAGYSHTANEDTVTLGGTLRSRDGDFNAQIAKDFNTMTPDTRYAAGFFVGAAVTASHVAMGDPGGGDSGVMVHVDGAPPGSAFEILINNAPRGLIKAGQTLGITLPAYRIYAVRLAPRGDAVLDFDAAARQVSLYPGNIQVLTWKAQKIVEVFGRVLDAFGRPMANAIIRGGRTPGLTDDNGYFQTEMTKDGKLTFEGLHNRVCEMTVTGVTAAATHLSLGPHACIAIEFADKPEPRQPEPAQPVKPALGIADAKPPPSGLQPTALVLPRPPVAQLVLRGPCGASLRCLEFKPPHSGPVARPGAARRRRAVEYGVRAALRRRHTQPGGGAGAIRRASARGAGPGEARPARHPQPRDPGARRA